MEIRTQHIVNREKKEITLMLYGELGKKVDGDYLAQELDYCDRNYDTVILRINSDGGLVTQGLSIVSQLLRMQAYTIAQIDGVAASMAAVIPVACDEVRMNDYARIMIHSPYMIDGAGKAIKMSAKDKKAAESIKGILVDLLSKRGKSKEEISKLLNDETWFTADEALAAGLVHSIIATGRPELKAIAANQLVACISKEESLQIPIIHMKQICAKLGLPENSDESVILAKMQERDTAAAAQSVKLVDRYLELGRKSGAVTDDNAEKMRRLAAADFDLFVDMLKLDNVTKPAGGQERISDHIVDSLGKKADEKNTKDFDWYQKNDPQALAKMEISEPDRFKKLMDAYNAQFV